MSNRATTVDAMRIEVRVTDAARGEELAADAYEAGALGLEEREDGDGILLVLYAPAERAAEVQRAAVARVGSQAVAAPAPLEPANWSEAWKQGLEAIVVSPRLVVRPSFVEHEPEPGQVVLVIDPAQAFGTGAHASTRLALGWVDALAASAPSPARWLDVGCGSGVLGLAAAALCDARVVACDIDPLASQATRDHARQAGVAARLQVFTGSLAALAAAPFDVVLANLLKSELLPLVEPLTERLAPEGRLVLAGLLEEDALEVLAAFAARGLGEAAPSRRLEDPTGVWLAPCLERSRRGDPAR